MNATRPSVSRFALVLAVALMPVAGPAAQQPATGDALEQFEQAPYSFTQLEAAQKIVKTADRRALERLLPWLTRPDRHERGNAAFVFAGLGDARGFQTLIEMLSDRSDRPIDPMNLRGNLFQAPRAAQLAAIIQDDRYYAVHLLGELRNPRAIDALLPLLADESVNYKVAWALGLIGDQRAVGPLIAMLSDGKALNRVSAIHALEALRATEAIAPLSALLGDLALPSAGDRIPVSETASRAIAHLQMPGDVPTMLPPISFRSLPVDVRQVLEQRGCEIPQPRGARPFSNVVSGHFTSASATDIAVLCSRNGTSVILVFRGESSSDVAELAAHPDAEYFQTVDGRGTRGYSRVLIVSTVASITARTRTATGPRLSVVDHEGIEDAFAEKASVIWYWFEGRWLQIPGSD